MQLDRQLTSAEFARLKKLLHHLAGIALKPGKEALAVGRLRRRMRELDIDDITKYLSLVETDATGQEATLLIDSLSTNVTSFYREPAHFTLFSQFLAERKKAGIHKLRVWCAAAATGEEPWTLAMLMRQAFPEPAFDLALLATDISTRALAIARQGVYENSAVAKLPIELTRRWFTSDATTSTVSDDLRPLVTFNRMNLVRPPYPMHGQFDVIFCRNVMIYFENPERLAVINEIHRLLVPGGILCLGHAESLTGLDSRLKTIAPAAYQMPKS